MKKKNLVLIIVGGVVTTLALAVAIPFAVLGIRTANLKSNYTYLKEDNKYSEKVEVLGVNLVTQQVSCGYATIEMLSEYYGDKVSEKELDEKNKGGVSTSSSSGFLKEASKSIPNNSFKMRNYLKNDVLLKEIHDSLKNNNPVAIEWAAKYENQWTLHFSVVTALDIKNNNVKIYNPYGYIENIQIEEFISRTSFNAYKNIPLFLNFGFAFGAFDKNVVFYAK